MTLYTKIPVTVQAQQYVKDVLYEPFIRDAFDRGILWWNKGHQLFVETGSGAQIVRPGDWVIQGVEGEMYPCVDSVFQKTYRPASPVV